VRCAAPSLRLITTPVVAHSCDGAPPGNAAAKPDRYVVGAARSRTAASHAQPNGLTIDPVSGDTLVVEWGDHCIARVNDVGRGNRFVAGAARGAVASPCPCCGTVLVSRFDTMDASLRRSRPTKFTGSVRHAEPTEVEVVDG
jgi:hypothetical protein